VDILAALPAAKAGLVAARLEPEFFIQLSDLRDAIALAPSLQDDPMHRASCNLVHRSSFFRVDLFIASGRPYERAQFARRIPQTVALNPDRHAYFVSPEDIILIKLDWYRMAQGVLDRQWSDVQSVLATQGSTLDTAYLRGIGPRSWRSLTSSTPPCAGRRRHGCHHQAMIRHSCGWISDWPHPAGALAHDGAGAGGESQSW